MKIKEITASEGTFLTQKDEVENRIFVTAIKGININENDWIEVSELEKEKYLNNINYTEE